jgi:DNA polymerase elongation subunit (family B)
MLVDLSQKGNNLTVSYTNETGSIDLHTFDINATNGYGVFDHVICDESDPDKEPNLRHYKDNLPIKKVPSWRLDFDEMRQFLLTQTPEDIREKMYAFNVLDMFMADIEIDIEDGEVFPDPQKAAYPIDSIQITSPELKTVILSTNSRVEQDRKQMKKIEKQINDHYKDIPAVWELVDHLDYAHIKFDTEVELLEYWWKMVLEKLHSVAFWNGEFFDVPYLNNRCDKLGVDMGLGSPTGEVSHMQNWPKHRYVFDYMQIVQKWAHDIFPLPSVGLDAVTNRIFDIGKVQYEGSYVDLYNGPIDTFMVYGAVDTINMQLIHKVKNYTAAKDSLVYYTKTSLVDSTMLTAQIHALCWDELWADGKINAIPFEKQVKKHYKGAYVKEPLRKFAMFPVGVDFSALYPRIMQSFNMSFENYVGKVKDDAHKKQLESEGYYVSVNNNYYKNDKDYTLRKIENKLLDERYAYKDLMMNMYLKAMGPIEKELKRRNLTVKL